MAHKRVFDDQSYNILMALTSSLEALEVYHKYTEDGNTQLWQKLIEHTEAQVDLLKAELPKVVTASQK